MGVSGGRGAVTMLNTANEWTGRSLEGSAIEGGPAVSSPDRPEADGLLQGMVLRATLLLPGGLVRALSSSFQCRLNRAILNCRLLPALPSNRAAFSAVYRLAKCQKDYKQKKC